MRAASALAAFLMLAFVPSVVPPVAAEWAECVIPPPDDVESTATDVSNIITWTPPSLVLDWEILYYRVYRAVWEDVILKGYELIAEVDGVLTSYEDFAIIPGVTYSYIVSAVSPCGEGLPSPPTTPQYPNCEVVRYHIDHQRPERSNVTEDRGCLFPLPPLPVPLGLNSVPDPATVSRECEATVETLNNLADPNVHISDSVCAFETNMPEGIVIGVP